MKSRKGKVYKCKKQMNENVIKERRNRANARERRRMIQLRIAYSRLKEYLCKSMFVKVINVNNGDCYDLAHPNLQNITRKKIKKSTS